MAKGNDKILEEKTNLGPGKTSLYYYNNGLFSDVFLEDRLLNIENKKIESRSFLNTYWNVDESDPVGFNKAFQEVLNLWIEMDENVQDYCQNEAQLEEHWIKPILKILGWTYEVQDKIEKRGKKQWPDYSLFQSTYDYKKAKNSQLSKKFVHASSVADAKAWNISLDGNGYTNSNPSFQIVNYMELTKKIWGILTNGQYWRLYSLRPDTKHTTFYEVDLIKILSTKDYKRFKFFFNFFRAEAFKVLPEINDRTFLDYVYDDGQNYKLRVENNLKARAFTVVEGICRGFAHKKKLREDELAEYYDHSLYYLFKLMFILNCESKGLLEVGKQDDYYLNGSLRKKCFELKEQWEKSTNWASGYSTYDYITNLFSLLKNGDERIGVHSLGDEVFRAGNIDFYSKNKIPDFYLNEALVQLSTDYDSEKERQFIDYKILSPDHIGSLFEGLLEYKLKKATEEIIIVDGKIKSASEVNPKNKKQAQVIKAGELYLANQNNERKDLGAYYTPEYIVSYISKRVFESIQNLKTTDDVLSLKVCDPAMGSGHFLLGVVKHLELKIQEIQEQNPDNNDNVKSDMISWNVLRNCVYGVDVNPLAVELSKFSLWIYTAKKGCALEPLSDQLKYGNSLVDRDPRLKDNFVWEREFSEIFKEGGFDVVVGNPPYLGERGNKETFRYIRSNGELASKTYRRKMDLFYWFIMKGIDILKDSGVISYITTNYWPTADGAEELKSYLIEHGALVEYIDFMNSKIFKDAQGQCNSLFVFLKSKNWSRQNIQIIRAKIEFEKESLHWNREIPIGSEKYFKSKMEKLNLICPVDNSWTISKKSTNNNSFSKSSGKKIDRNVYSSFLGKENISMGVQTGADKVTVALLKLAIKKKKIKESEKEAFDLKEGIYVVSKEFANKQGFERNILKNFYKNSDIGYYIISKEKSEKLIYVDSKEDINDYPKVKKHLSKFRKLLESREQVGSEDSNWYWIRGAKREKIHNKVTVVCPYRSTVPKFALSNKEVYGAGDLYFIYEFNGLDPDVMLGYLNSSYVEQWFEDYGKKKGNLFELYQTPLSEIPAPILTSKAQSQIKGLVNKINDSVESMISISKDDVFVKSLMDVVAEFKGESLAKVKSQGADAKTIKEISSIISYLSSIDEIIYSEMIDNPQYEAA